MAGEDNIAAAKRGYAAFTAGDPAAAMAEMADDIVWVVPGNSAISGTTEGKQKLAELWARFGEKGFATSPQHWFSDDERVVVLVEMTLAGETFDAADALTFRDGKLVRFQTTSDTALLERVFGTA
jgi:uncharacterized protein